ncbi:hypothetical protein [Plantactinospora sp. KBS50]|uniref:hypothetical protein n=1 Tax=Plantactinospora sp. KBS50 TaxID=2024580 RepID=UPI000BAAE0BF|nr:hypothetical protein [Plantactinospora sp. KBS50]ASW52951.1 hypothetical protein CIK06_00230 [Plantactinospora sp. KBS50]
MTVAATLVVHRSPATWRDRLPACRLLVDGTERGELAPGRELRLVVTPGRHRARAKIGWTGSPELEFEVGAGGEVRLRLGPNGGFGSAFWQIFTRDRYLRLDPAD